MQRPRVLLSSTIASICNTLYIKPTIGYDTHVLVLHCFVSMLHIARVKKGPHRLTVRTPAFQAVNRSSILRGVTNTKRARGALFVFVTAGVAWLRGGVAQNLC